MQNRKCHGLGTGSCDVYSKYYLFTYEILKYDINYYLLKNFSNDYWATFVLNCTHLASWLFLNLVTSLLVSRGQW